MKKPKIVIAPKGCNSYFTEGKEYKVIDFSCLSLCFFLISDDYKNCFCILAKCNHLNGGNWIIKEEE